MERAEAQHYLNFAKGLKLAIEGPKSEEASKRLDAEKQQLQEALAWFIENGELESAQILASILWRSWMNHGHVKEGRELVTRLLKLPRPKPPTKARAEVLLGTGMLAFRQDDNKEAERFFQESLTISRETGDKATTVLSLTGLARVALREGNYANVKARSEEARTLARGMGDEFRESRPLHMLAAATKMEGDLPGAQQLYEESLALARKLGDDAMVSVELDNLGSVALHQGNIGLAKDRYRQAGELFYKMRSMYSLPYLPLHFSMVALEEGKLERAVKLLGASEVLFESGGMAPDPDESVERDRVVSSLRKSVDQTKFDSLWAEGRHLTLDQAVQYSLET